MDWVLFLQIEVIVLTIGFTVLMAISHYQNVKDSSRQERWNIIIKILEQATSTVSERAKNSQDLEKALNNLLKKYSAECILSLALIYISFLLFFQL
jgi:hypothetical protein